MASFRCLGRFRVSPPSGGWIGAIVTLLGSRPAGTVVVTSDGSPAELGDLLRALVDRFADVDVRVSPRAVEDAPRGSLLVLVVDGTNVEQIGQEWALAVAGRGVRVVLWCDLADAVGRVGSPFPWIPVRRGLDLDLPRHAVLGVRCALAARAPGVACGLTKGASSRAVELLSNLVWAALPGRPLRWLYARLPHERLVSIIASAGAAWVGSTAYVASHARRLRWALAESHRRARVVVSTYADQRHAWFPGFHPVCAEHVALRTAIDRLASAGVSRPALMAGLTGLEPEAVEFVGRLAEAGIGEQAVLAALCACSDPGASLALLGRAEGMLALDDVANATAAPPAMRAFAASAEVTRRRDRIVADIGARLYARRTAPDASVGLWAAYTRKPMPIAEVLGNVTVRAFTPEPLLRRGPAGAAQWADLARTAVVVGAMDAAATWALRSLAAGRRRTGEMRWVAERLEAYGNLRGAEGVRRALPAQGSAVRALTARTGFRRAVVHLGPAVGAVLVMSSVGVGAAFDLVERFGSIVPLFFAVWIWIILVQRVLHRAGDILAIHGPDAPYRRGSMDLDATAALVESIELAYAKGLDQRPDLLGTVYDRFDRTHPLYHVGLQRLAVPLVRQGQHDAAFETILYAVLLAANENGHDHGAFARLIPTLAFASIRAGRPEEAERFARRLVDCAAVSAAHDPPRESIDRLVGRLREDMEDEPMVCIKADRPPLDAWSKHLAFDFLEEFVRIPIPATLISPATRIEATRALADALAAQRGSADLGRRA